MITNKTIAQHISFLHIVLYNPVLSTLYDAIGDGFLTIWLEITSKLVRKYSSTSDAMIKGNLEQKRQNQRKTHSIINPPASNALEEVTPPLPPPNLPPIRNRALYETSLAATG